MEEDRDDFEATPDWPEEFNAPVAKLGPPLSVHRFTDAALRRKILLGLAGILLSLVFNFVYWVVLGFAFIEKYILLLLFGPGILGIALIVQSLRHRGLWVLRFPMGLLFWKRGVIGSFPWDELESVAILGYHGETAVMPWAPDMDDDDEGNWRAQIPLANGFGSLRIIQIQLNRGDGEEIALPSSLGGFVELGELIQREIFDRKWPAIWQAFQAGQSQEFAGVTVTLGGLFHKTNTLPWTEFESAAVTQGTIAIRRTGRNRAWLILPLKGLPNPHLFLWLLVRGRLPVAMERDEELPSIDE